MKSRQTLTLTEDALVQRLRIELEDLAYEHEVEFDSIHTEWEEKYETQFSHHG